MLTEDTPQRPTTEKGRIRVAMEALFRREAEAGRVRTTLLRAGDFFGGKGTGALVRPGRRLEAPQGRLHSAGPVDLVHEWTFLPDLAAAFVALAERRGSLGAYEDLNFAGHAITDLEMKAAAERVLGRKLKLAAMPWWVLRLGAPSMLCGGRSWRCPICVSRNIGWRQAGSERSSARCLTRRWSARSRWRSPTWNAAEAADIAA